MPHTNLALLFIQTTLQSLIASGRSHSTANPLVTIAFPGAVQKTKTGRERETKSRFASQARSTEKCFCPKDSGCFPNPFGQL